MTKTQYMDLVNCHGGKMLEGKPVFYSDNARSAFETEWQASTDLAKADSRRKDQVSHIIAMIAIGAI